MVQVFRGRRVTRRNENLRIKQVRTLETRKIESITRNIAARQQVTEARSKVCSKNRKKFEEAAESEANE
jgi:hypothetical protein